MFDSLLNNPVLFTIIMVAIVVIAVGLILYFLVFKDKIKQYFENRKIEKEKKLARMESDKALASEVFANKATKDKKPTSLTRKEQEDINKVISTVGNKGSLVSQPVKEKTEVKELTAEEQAEIDKKLSSMHGGVSSVGKSQPKQAKPKKTNAKKDKEDEDKVTSGGLDFMNQFNKKDKE